MKNIWLEKTKVIYENKDPFQNGVRFIAIQTGSIPLYVWETYFTRDKNDILKLPDDLVILPIESAKRLFDFQEGKLADLIRE